MKTYLQSAAGREWELSVYAYELRWTGGVPCDSFTLHAPYEPEMAEALRAAARFTAVEGDAVVFRGVVDEYVCELGPAGRTLTVTGRGMAALLLDNEAEAAVYERATLPELLRRHVAPYGIECRACDALAGGAYSVEHGASEWRALSGFTEYYGGFSPYFTRDGALLLQKERPCAELTLGRAQRVTALRYRDRRYGVISEAAVIDRRTRTHTVLRNEAFLARGGCRRRVCYAPAASDYRSARFTAAEQLARSREDSETLRVTIAGAYEAAPGDRLIVTASALGVTGAFTVSEVTRRLDGSGETTLLNAQRE